VEKGETLLFDEVRYFFYITNDRKMTAQQIVFFANDRCNCVGFSIFNLRTAARTLRGIKILRCFLRAL